MLSTIAAEVLIIFGLLVLNGVFAMSELAIVSARKVRLEHRAEAGNAGARAALELSADSARFLSTVQIGITLVGVIASVFGGATIAEVLEQSFEQVPALAPRAEAMSLAIVVSGITFLSLIVGELVPKRIALRYPETIAGFVARPMKLLAKLMYPLVALLTGASTLILKPFGLHGRVDPRLTEEEIHALVEQGAETGAVPQAEHELVEGIFRVGDRQVGSIMTPRPDIRWIDVTADAATVRHAFGEEGQRFVLVCDRSVEHVAGIAYADDLLRQSLDGQPFDLRSTLVPPLYVPASMPVLQLLDEMRKAEQVAGVVLDEYGGVAGLVSLDDILEEVVGNLPGQAEAPAPLVSVGDGVWTADGSLLVDDVEFELDVGPFTVRGTRGFRTLGGFIMTSLGRLPESGDAVAHDGHRFEVVTMHGRRVQAVKISKIRL